MPIDLTLNYSSLTAEINNPLAMTKCSVGKSKITLTWNAILATAITYSHNANMLKAEKTINAFNF